MSSAIVTVATVLTAVAVAGVAAAANPGAGQDAAAVHRGVEQTLGRGPALGRDATWKVANMVANLERGTGAPVEMVCRSR